MTLLGQLNQSLQVIIYQTHQNMPVLMVILIVLWMSYFFTQFIDRRLLLLGIIPRHLRGLTGILFAPLLHADFNHLFFNTIPLIVLSNFVLINGLPSYIYVTLSITILSGVGIWCFAKSGLHIGASALVTGYWGFLISNIFNQGTLMTLILGLVSIYYFAGIFLGVFPGKKGVSWEGHLSGLIAGLITSYFYYGSF